MDLQLKGKKAIVTGSTQGIGFAIAKSLAKEGAKVFVNGRSDESVNKAIERLSSEISDADLEGIAADLSNAEGVDAFIEKVPNADILVNNLGIFEPKDFGKISDDDWLKFFETNVMSGVRLSRHYLPGMKRQDWGRIIFISSESGVNIPVEMIHYGFTKSAQLSISRGLAETTKGTNVTVNSVLPGPTESEGVIDFVDKLANEKGITKEEMNDQFFDESRPSSLLQRFIKTEEIGDVVAFVSSPLSAAINGTALRVDGGVIRSLV